MAEPQIDDNPFIKNSLNNTGTWTEERLRKIPMYKEQICILISDGLFLSEICQQLDMMPNTVRRWRHEDKTFDESYTDAESSVTDTLEKEAIRRARNGILEPMVSAGKLVMNKDGEILQTRKYSDSLMQFLLKGRRKEVYGDKREIEGNIGIDVVGAKSNLESKFAAAVAVSTDEE